MKPLLLIKFFAPLTLLFFTGGSAQGGILDLFKSGLHFCYTIIQDQDGVYYDTIYTQQCIEGGLRSEFKDTMRDFAQLRQLQFNFFGKQITAVTKCVEIKSKELEEPIRICEGKSVDADLRSKGCNSKLVEGENICIKKAVIQHQKTLKRDLMTGQDKNVVERGKEEKLKEVYDLLGRYQGSKPKEGSDAFKLMSLPIIHGTGMNPNMFKIENPGFIRDKSKTVTGTGIQVNSP